MLVLPSYRNQSIDLHNKSINWCVYEGKSFLFYMSWISRKIWYRKRLHICIFQVGNLNFIYIERSDATFNYYHWKYFRFFIAVPMLWVWNAYIYLNVIRRIFLQLYFIGYVNNEHLNFLLDIDSLKVRKIFCFWCQ